jgi:hypothetical protein
MKLLYLIRRKRTGIVPPLLRPHTPRGIARGGLRGAAAPGNTVSGDKIEILNDII